MLENTSVENLAKRKITDLMRKIRRQTPQINFNTRGVADSDNSRIDYINGKPVKRIVITLRSMGCSWTLANGGCTMCGHYAATTQGKKIPASSFIEQFKKEFNKYDFKDYPVLCVYNSGSILNEEELPKEARKEICRIISTNRNINKVVFETRTEHATKEILTDLVDLLGDKDVEIAVGLESSNEKILQLCINKGLLLKSFVRTAKIIKSIVDLRVYLLIKPPFITEGEAINDAISSTKYLQSEIKPKSIHFEPCTVQRYSLVYYLWRDRYYRLPWLWSITEILRSLDDVEKIYVSPFKHIPKPDFIPHNCGQCDEEIKSAIFDDFNFNHDKTIFAEIVCNCKNEWKEELELDNTPIPDRIFRVVGEIEKQIKYGLPHYR